MLIRITNKCNMWCKHCFLEGLTKNEDHMTMDTFKEALGFADRAGVLLILFSGGEPTLHPQFLEFIDVAIKFRDGDRFPVVVTTNGTVFDDNPKLGKQLLKLAKPDGRVLIQVTNDDRYYPRKLKFDPKILEGTRSSYTDRIAGLYPCDRVKEMGVEPTAKAPACFNIRSLTRNRGLNAAIQTLELQLNRHCVPSINIDGSIHAGEMDWCRRVGHVTDPIHKVETFIQQMRCCDKCDRLHNLSRQQLWAIGEERLVTLS